MTKMPHDIFFLKEIEELKSKLNDTEFKLYKAYDAAVDAIHVLIRADDVCEERRTNLFRSLGKATVAWWNDHIRKTNQKALTVNWLVQAEKRAAEKVQSAEDSLKDIRKQLEEAKRALENHDA